MRTLTALALVVVLSTGCEIDFSKLSGPRPEFRPMWEGPYGPLRLIRGVPYETEIVFKDPEKKYAVSLSADLSGLPAGTEASFKQLPTRFLARTRRGTFRWTPGPDERGPYVVTFIGQRGPFTHRWNLTVYTALPGPDVAPILTAPDTAWVAVGDTVTFAVTVIDPNDEPIFSWNIGTLNPNDMDYFDYGYLPADTPYPTTRIVRVACIKDGLPGISLHINGGNRLSPFKTVEVRVKAPT